MHSLTFFHLNEIILESVSNVFTFAHLEYLTQLIGQLQLRIWLS